MTCNFYFSDIRKFRELIRRNPSLIGNRFFCIANIGTLRIWCIFGYPIFSREFCTNFKTKYFLGTIPIVSIKRSRSNRLVKKATNSRNPRVYLSVGSLPFHDNGSGIPRVAKMLTEEGLAQSVVSFYPVYPDPVTGIYRIASEWCRERNLPINTDNKESIDPEITVTAGDWLIQTMINPNAVEFYSDYLRSFQTTGGYLGVVLHDIIAIEHPEFFKRRDAVNFSKWLNLIANFDGLFAISRSTQVAFEIWRTNNRIVPCPLTGCFHLGANFKNECELTNTPLMTRLKKQPYFLQVSTLEPRKGHAQLIDAFEILWKRSIDVNIVFVGREGWLVGNLCRRIKRHPEFNRRLFWNPHVSDMELQTLYSCATGIVVASEAEGFGLPVVEGLYYQKPVIARDIPVFREVGENRLVYFKGLEPQGLVDAIVHVLRHPESTPVPKTSITTWKQSFEQFASLVQDFSSQLNHNKTG